MLVINKKCPPCGGRIFRDEEKDDCLQCGYVKYTKLAKDEATGEPNSVSVRFQRFHKRRMVE